MQKKEKKRVAERERLEAERKKEVESEIPQPLNN
jgi:hypothetical protein